MVYRTGGSSKSCPCRRAHVSSAGCGLLGNFLVNLSVNFLDPNLLVNLLVNLLEQRHAKLLLEALAGGASRKFPRGWVDTKLRQESRPSEVTWRLSGARASGGRNVVEDLRSDPDRVTPKLI
jgi:hypothetical protein